MWCTESGPRLPRGEGEGAGGLAACVVGAPNGKLKGGVLEKNWGRKLGATEEAASVSMISKTPVAFDIDKD